MEYPRAAQNVYQRHPESGGRPWTCFLTLPPTHTPQHFSHPPGPQADAVPETATETDTAASLQDSAHDFKLSSASEDSWTSHLAHCSGQDPATVSMGDDDGGGLAPASEDPSVKRLKMEACDSDNPCTSSSSHNDTGDAPLLDEADQKRQAYLEKRRKNNASAKKSRDNRREKEAAMERQLEMLRIEEMRLQRQLARRYQRNALLRQLMRAWTAMYSYNAQGGTFMQE